MSKEKDNVIQIMRGIAIVTVLFRHAIAQVNAGGVLRNIEQIIICFHMPVFFVIAGFLFQSGIHKYEEQGVRKFLSNKLKHLMIPYVFWTVLLWSGVQIACAISPSSMNKMIEIGFEPMDVCELLYGLATYQFYYTEHLWFLYVLFILFAINILFRKYGATSFAILLWGMVGILSITIPFPHIVKRLMLWGIFFTFGRFVKVNKLVEKIRGGAHPCYIYSIFANEYCAFSWIEFRNEWKAIYSFYAD